MSPRRPATTSRRNQAGSWSSSSFARPDLSIREIEVRKAGTQVDDLLEEIHKRVAVNERVLVTCLTKKMAEDLTDYYHDLGIRVRYLHSDIETIERVEIIRSLRKGDFDVLVGINLLREGLDLPEVSLVAILDADKEGYLRSARSLIQTTGRAARHINGRVIMYADVVTKSMEQAIGETNRRRAKQVTYNEQHGITPTSIIKAIDASLVEMYSPEWAVVPEIGDDKREEEIHPGARTAGSNHRAATGNDGSRGKTRLRTRRRLARPDQKAGAARIRNGSAAPSGATLAAPGLSASAEIRIVEDKGQ